MLFRLSRCRKTIQRRSSPCAARESGSAQRCARTTQAGSERRASRHSPGRDGAALQSTSLVGVVNAPVSATTGIIAQASPPGRVRGPVRVPRHRGASNEHTTGTWRARSCATKAREASQSSGRARRRGGKHEAGHVDRARYGRCEDQPKLSAAAVSVDAEWVGGGRWEATSSSLPTRGDDRSLRYAGRAGRWSGAPRDAPTGEARAIALTKRSNVFAPGCWPRYVGPRRRGADRGEDVEKSVSSPRSGAQPNHLNELDEIGSTRSTHPRPDSARFHRGVRVQGASARCDDEAANRMDHRDSDLWWKTAVSTARRRDVMDGNDDGKGDVQGWPADGQHTRSA